MLGSIMAQNGHVQFILITEKLKACR